MGQASRNERKGCIPGKLRLDHAGEQRIILEPDLLVILRRNVAMVSKVRS